MVNTSYLIPRANAYNIDTGVNVGSAGAVPSTNTAVGLTQDSTKSGIVADVSTLVGGLNLYYYVGEIVQNLNLIDVAQMTTALTNKADIDLSNVNNQGTALSTSWMTTDASYEIQLTPPVSSSSGSTLANTTLFTAPCNGWVMIEAITNNSNGRFWIFGASSVIFSSEFHGNGSSKTSGIFVKKGEQVILRGAYVSTIHEILFRPCEGTKWEVQ